MIQTILDGKKGNKSPLFFTLKSCTTKKLNQENIILSGSQKVADYSYRYQFITIKNLLL
ncbi:hypothetical protein SAMN05880573_113116 [Chryseobacterium sp. RU33C]|nr:hypothetical protein SAMN05880573_113116 [Chryseobacterium sp. RU33C]